MADTPLLIRCSLVDPLLRLFFVLSSRILPCVGTMLLCLVNAFVRVC